MSQPIIEVQNISKSYTIAHREPYQTLRDTAANFVLKPFQLFRGKEKDTTEEFWALRDVNFAIERGERIGIIGRNGAGKSTLLKILSQITTPTTGQVTLRGRVASLLEVGTGFHPELSGRENIFLNGTILGMKQSEIRKKFDEIVAFAEIEKFIDTPVKRYSSGMYVRLAFAVAAHLEPEILIVDEVLAVGDIKFQKKCLGKMEEVGRDGRTVIFVSHNMGAINQLCTKTILFERGRLVEFGPTANVISKYTTEETKDLSHIAFDEKTHRSGTGEYKIDSVTIKNGRSEETRKFSMGDEVVFSVKYHPNNPSTNDGFGFGLSLATADGLAIANSTNADSNFTMTHLTGAAEITIRFKDIRLYPDTYTVGLWIGRENGGLTDDHIENACSFEIVNGGTLTARALPHHMGHIFFTPEWGGKKIEGVK